jgi:hypothetical protein
MEMNRSILRRSSRTQHLFEKRIPRFRACHAGLRTLELKRAEATWLSQIEGEHSRYHRNFKQGPARPIEQLFIA